MDKNFIEKNANSSLFLQANYSLNITQIVFLTLFFHILNAAQPWWWMVS